MAGLAQTSWGRGVSGSAGAIATIAVHLVVGFLLLSGKGPVKSEPQPLAVKMIGETPQQPAKPLPVRAEPVLDRPKLNIPQPDIVLADNSPAPTAPVAVSSAAAPSAPAEPQQALDSMPQFDVDYLDNPAPKYPALSRRMREQGVVLVRVFVSPEGRPETVELKRSSGSLRLDESALSAVRNWKFVPAQCAGRAVAAWVVVPISFSLTA